MSLDRPLPGRCGGGRLLADGSSIGRGLQADRRLACDYVYCVGAGGHGITFCFELAESGERFLGWTRPRPDASGRGLAGTTLLQDRHGGTVREFSFRMAVPPRDSAGEYHLAFGHDPGASFFAAPGRACYAQGRFEDDGQSALALIGRCLFRAGELPAMPDPGLIAGCLLSLALPRRGLAAPRLKLVNGRRRSAIAGAPVAKVA